MQNTLGKWKKGNVCHIFSYKQQEPLREKEQQQGVICIDTAIYSSHNYNH